MKWLMIDCNCIFAGCPPPIPLFHAIISKQPSGYPQFHSPLRTPGVAIDLYDIQRAIFKAMGQN